MNILHLRDGNGVGTRLERPLSDVFRKWSSFFDIRDRNKKKRGDLHLKSEIVFNSANFC